MGISTLSGRGLDGNAPPLAAAHARVVRRVCRARLAGGALPAVPLLLSRLGLGHAGSGARGAGQDASRLARAGARSGDRRRRAPVPALGAREEHVPRSTRLPPGLAGALGWLGPAALGLLALALVGWTRLPAHAAPQRAHVGDGHDDVWDFAIAHLHGRHVAYTGSILPLPLWGWLLENRVQYVNIAGKAT